jgi:hypothetical protein
MINKAKDNNNYIISEKPFPTYVFENVNLLDGNEKVLKKKVEKAYEQVYNLVDEANDELRDFANNKAAEFETKENSADLDLARDLFTIYVKDGYKYGFSMILEFDDMFIDGINKQQRTELQNSIQSYAVSLMKDIANKTKMNAYGEKAVENKQTDEEETVDSLKKQIDEIQQALENIEDPINDVSWRELMREKNDLSRKLMKLKNQNNKAQDSADLQIKIEITAELAEVLIKNVECNNEKVTFRIEGSDFTIIHSDPIHHYFEDYKQLQLL